MASKRTYTGLIGTTAGMVRGQSNKTANYTVLAKDNGMEFTTTGAGAAVVFTLPTLAPGLWFKFRNCVNQDMTVAAATANTIMSFNDTAASSVVLNTANEKIGGVLIFYANNDGTLWFYDKPCRNTETMT